MTPTIALDHVIAYAADGGLAEIKSDLRAFGFMSSSHDRTNIGRGVHAAYFQLGDIVLEFLSVVDPAEFAAAKGKMPFSEGLRNTQAAFGIGYVHQDVFSLHQILIASGLEVQKPYGVEHNGSPNHWVHQLLDDLFEGTAPFISSYSPDERPSPDGVGLGKLEEIWFVTSVPSQEAALWCSVFSNISTCGVENQTFLSSVTFEGRVLRWMTADEYRRRAGKEQPKSCAEKYGQLSAFVLSVSDPETWNACLSNSQFPILQGDGYEGVHLDRGTDITILTANNIPPRRALHAIA